MKTGLLRKATRFIPMAPLITFVALITIALGWRTSAWGAVVNTPTPAKALKTLVTQTTALSPSAVAVSKRVRLIAIARQARAIGATKPCAAVLALNAYRKVLRSTRLRAGVAPRLRPKFRQRLAVLASTSMTASSSLLRLKATKACGGGVAPSELPGAEVAILGSDETGLSARILLPAVHFVPKVGNGKVFTQLVAPNTDSPGAPGTPGIPVVSEIFGVPDGATVEVTPGGVQSQTLDGVDVFPVQPAPVDAVNPAPNFFGGDFQQPPFTLDRAAYGTAGLVPPQPAAGGVFGQFRDLTIGSLQIPTAQYDPVKKRLKVLTSVDVRVTFTGGTQTFSDRIGSPWETAQNRIAGSMINSAVVKKPRGPIVFKQCGEELLVITSPATRAAADTFAAARTAAGFLTTVVETGTIGPQIGTTTAQIQTFIRGELTAASCVHPNYVTIVGDDQLVPTFTATPGAIPSDLPYSMKNDADELPDVAVGRIIANDLAQANAAVAKIVAYETSPPTGAMLTHATIAAMFQDDDNDGTENRTFVQFAETVRNGLLARGVTVDRVYGEGPGNNPQKFNDGTSLPAELKKPTFGWNGTAAQLSAAWNEGRFMIVHRDHGWSDGWGTPEFTTDDVDALTNGASLPVVLSINCSSGAYDIDDTSFAQNALTMAAGGAVGVFGDTRDSPSWHNSQIALGFVDALLPSVLAGEGPAAAQRTGDALIHGKLRLAGLAPPSGPGIAGGDANTRRELYLWHYYGDPSMQMWGGGQAPLVFLPQQFTAVLKFPQIPPPGDPPYLVEITLPPELVGQPFSLLRGNRVVGKALAGGSTVQVLPILDPLPIRVLAGELMIAIDADGAVPVQLAVQ